MPIEVKTDATVARSFVHRAGVGRMKHIDVRQEWVRALRDADVCKLVKVDTKLNHADLLTKILDPDTFERLRDRMMTRHRLSTHM